MAFQPGQVVYADYGEIPVCIHTRLVLGHIQGLEYLVRTPDGDVYPEILDASNPDYTNFYVGPDDGSRPAGVAPGSIYGFPPMTVADLNAILASGRLEVVAERGRRGIVDAAPALADAQMVWVLAEWIPGKKIGDRLTPPPGHVRQGDWGLMELSDSNDKTRPVLIRQLRIDEIPGFCEDRISLARSSEAAEGEDLTAGEDVRTLEVKYGASGERQRSFKETISEMIQCDFEDYPFEIRTALPYLKAISGVAESSFAQHLSWVAQSRIPEGDRAIYENEVLSRALDLAVTYDSLNVANLASFELLIRRKQLLAEAHAHAPGQPSYEGADHFLGTSYRPGGAIVIPELTKHVAERMHQESQVLKEKRKQAELKGRGRGKPPKPTPNKGGGGDGN